MKLFVHMFAYSLTFSEAVCDLLLELSTSRAPNLCFLGVKAETARRSPVHSWPLVIPIFRTVWSNPEESVVP